MAHPPHNLLPTRGHFFCGLAISATFFKIPSGCQNSPPPWPRGRRRSPAIMSGFLRKYRRSVPIYQLGTTLQTAVHI
ncbi:uncharacterized protein CLUP02_14082 [Colletotrichum lupini]|uniref:Uncharacterized protein n=1 Tax=Colletotrichum lupini TaxID=145971 RepID=A0A9Q8T3Q3_9PEZI|nr:uncharacterized protein CLUP02_14082 [Colletotrichum lupini]UQC88557.1 hypothetical protein CLUP02_14082 [Colletotrichum lupini]